MLADQQGMGRQVASATPPPPTPHTHASNVCNAEHCLLMASKPLNDLKELVQGNYPPRGMRPFLEDATMHLRRQNAELCHYAQGLYHEILLHQEHHHPGNRSSEVSHPLNYLV